MCNYKILARLRMEYMAFLVVHVVLSFFRREYKKCTLFSFDPSELERFFCGKSTIFRYRTVPFSL